MAIIGIPQVNVRMSVTAEPYAEYVYSNEADGMVRTTFVDFLDPLTGMTMRLTEDEWAQLGNPPVIAVDVYAG